MTDEAVSLRESIARGPIGAHRVGTDKPKSVVSSNISLAVRDATVILSDHQWHRKSEFSAIAKNYRMKVETVLTHVEAAESITGHWVALVNDDTPECAPDEE